jgi:hypothetical protein
MRISSQLNISPQAWGVLRALKRIVARDSARRIRTLDAYGWYNGREKAIAVVARSDAFDRPVLVVVFGEIRNGDSIFVDAYEAGWSSAHPPSSTDPAYAAGYRSRVRFRYGEYEKAARHAAALIRRHFREAERAA